MSTVPYIFAGVTGNIPLSQLDQNFANVKLSVDYVIQNTQSNITQVGTLTSLSVSGNIVHSGDLIITGNISDPGQLDIRTTSGNSNIALQPDGTGIVTVSTQVSAVGNITGANIRATANINAGNIRTTGIVSATGNAISGNVLTGGFVSATGNATAGNVLTGGIVSATGNIFGNNLSLSGMISATGQIRSNTNILSGGFVSAPGNVTGGNITTAGLITATGNIVAAGDITGANFTTAGLITATGNITGSNVNIDNLLAGKDISLSGNIVVAGNATVNGNLTTINVQTLNIADKDIVVANNVSTSSLIDGAGILAGNPTVSSLIYSHANLGWGTSSNFNVGSNLTVQNRANITTANITNLSSSNATITGGSITGITDLVVADGGTGRSDLTTNAVLIGNGTAAVNFVSPGDSGNILTSNGTTWTSALNNAFGPGQTWQDVTGSRATDTTYTNSTSKPIFVIAQVGNQTNGVQVYINGTLVVRHWYDVNGGAGQIGYSTGEFMVPPGGTYYVTAGPLRQWWEYR